LIVGWYCVKCKANVPLNHFNECDAVHPDFAAAVLADSRKDRGEGVHVTSALGCPRRTAIECSVDVYVNPLNYNSILGGTAWHSLMETTSTRPELCEVEVRGVVGGIALVGKVDRLHPPTAISDWKTTSEWAEKWLSKPKDEGGGMKAEHLAQMSLYAELVEQSFGWRPTHGVVWYRTHKSHLPFAEALWSLDQTLAFKPLNGDFSISELISQLDRFYSWQNQTGALRCDWYELPLAGSSQMYGTKTACDYCSVRETCYQQAFGAPF
jgi:hypothetical protein